jgi:hypothetical protein
VRPGLRSKKGTVKREEINTRIAIELVFRRMVQYPSYERLTCKLSVVSLAAVGSADFLAGARLTRVRYRGKIELGRSSHRTSAFGPFQTSRFPPGMLVAQRKSLVVRSPYLPLVSL